MLVDHWLWNQTVLYMYKLPYCKPETRTTYTIATLYHAIESTGFCAVYIHKKGGKKRYAIYSTSSVNQNIPVVCIMSFMLVIWAKLQLSSSISYQQKMLHQLNWAIQVPSISGIFCTLMCAWIHHTIFPTLLLLGFLEQMMINFIFML